MPIHNRTFRTVTPVGNEGFLINWMTRLSGPVVLFYGQIFVLLELQAENEQPNFGEKQRDSPGFFCVTWENFSKWRPLTESPSLFHCTQRHKKL